jgi:hypothetical protein
MNNKGKSSGLALTLILIVALIVAFFFMKQSGSLGIGKPSEQNSAPVQQAQDVVNQINEQQEKALEALEGF